MSQSTKFKPVSGSVSDSASSCFFPWNYSALNWLGHSVLLTAFISLSYSPHLLSSSMWDACRKLNLLSWSEGDAVEARSHPYCAWRVLQCPSLLERHCSRPGVVCNGVGFVFFLHCSSFSGHLESLWITRIKAFCPGRHWDWMPLNGWVITVTKPIAFCLVSVNYLTCLCSALFFFHIFFLFCFFSSPREENPSLEKEGRFQCLVLKGN